MKQTKTKKYLKEQFNKYRFDSVVTLVIFTLIAIVQILLPLETK